MDITEAIACIESWQARTVTITLHPGPEHIQDTCKLLSQAGSAGGNLVTDAQIGAYALHHQAVVHTADYDFLRFSGVKTHYPLCRRAKKPNRRTQGGLHFAEHTCWISKSCLISCES
jgi:hypothetical protein